MVTDYPRPAASHGVLFNDDAPEAEDGFGTIVFDRVRQMFCGLYGHDDLLQWKPERMFLKCTSCGHESPGWELGETPPTVTIRGDSRRHVLVSARPQLVGARHVA